MNILQRVKNRFNLNKKNNCVDDIRGLTKQKIDEIHEMGRITYLEKASEWERGGICAPMECVGDTKSTLRCTDFSYNCHECLINFASRSESYEPFSNDFEFPCMDTDEPQVNWVEEINDFRKEYNNKHLARVKKRN